MSETAFILIVESDAQHGELLAERLRPEDRACRLANSREEAVESLGTRQPDVIVMDDAPHRNGTAPEELIRQTRRMAPDAQIVLLTPDQTARQSNE